MKNKTTHINERGNPSLIGVMFGKRETDIRYKMFLEDAEKLGVIIRPAEIVDISMPIESKERYNKAIKFLRKNTNLILKKYYDSIPFKSMITRQLEKKDLKEIDYSKIKFTDDEKAFRRYGSRGLMPLFMDTKIGKYNLSEEEKECHEALKTLNEVK